MRGGGDLGGARGAPVHSVWEAPHLWVAAIAGVPAYYEGQFGYLPERHEEPAAQGSPARGAARRVIAGRLELADLAEGAMEGVGPSGYPIVHFPHPFFPRWCYKGILERSMQAGGGERVCQVVHFLYACSCIGATLSYTPRASTTVRRSSIVSASRGPLGQG